MKNLVLASLLFLALPALSQEVWPQKNATAGEVARAECFRVEYNIARCETAGLKAGCTQAAINALEWPEGAEIPQLLNDAPAVRREIALSIGFGYLPVATSDRCKLVRQKVRWYSVLTQEQRDNYCTTVAGEAAGCYPFAR